MGNKQITIYLFRFPYVIVQLVTAMVGYTIHNSIGWSIVDYICTPLVWCKWLICKEVNITIIEQTFDFFLK